MSEPELQPDGPGAVRFPEADTARMLTWVKIHHRGAREATEQDTRTYTVGYRTVAVAWLRGGEWLLAMRPINCSRWG